MRHARRGDGRRIPGRRPWTPNALDAGADCSPSIDCPASWSPTPTGRPFADLARLAGRPAASMPQLRPGRSRRWPACSSESMADRVADKLGGKTVRDVLPEHLLDVPAAKADDTIIEVAAIMARLRSPLVAVMKDGRLRRRDHRLAPARGGARSALTRQPDGDPMTTVAVAVFVVAYALIASDQHQQDVKVALGGAAVVRGCSGVVGVRGRVLLPRDRDRLGRHLSAVRDDDHRQRAAPDRRLRVRRDLGGQAGQADPRCGS